MPEQRPRSASGPFAAAAAGLLALVVGCGTPSAGGPAAPDEPAGSSSSPAPEATMPVGQAPSTDGVADVAAQDASLEAAAERDDEQQAGPPVEVAHDRLGWTMPIDPVGVAPDGQMEIPEDALRAGWYRYGPGAGAAAGATVLAAHAGSYVTPRGPFWELTQARVGDVVRVVRADGGTTSYEDVSVESIEKDVIDLRPYFDRTGDPRAWSSSPAAASGTRSGRATSPTSS